MKVGIIRCMQTEDYCPGTGCFKAVREHGGAFNGEGEGIEIVGFCNCGGFPGKESVLRAKELVRGGGDTIALGACIQESTRIRYPCPFAKKMKTLIENDLPEGISILDFTH